MTANLRQIMSALHELEPFNGIGSTAGQIYPLIAGEAEGFDDRDLNPEAVRAIKENLGGIDPELDEALECYFSKYPRAALARHRKKNDA